MIEPGNGAGSFTGHNESRSLPAPAKARWRSPDCGPTDPCDFLLVVSVLVIVFAEDLGDAGIGDLDDAGEAAVWAAATVERSMPLPATSVPSMSESDRRENISAERFGTVA
jgi:hypothetical protein